MPPTWPEWSTLPTEQFAAVWVWVLAQPFYAKIGFGLLLGMGLLSLFMPSESKHDKYATQDRDMPRPSNTALWRRLWWRVRPPHDTMRVDGLVIDRTRRPHAAWLGPTGAGKSSAVAAVRLNGARPTLCVTPDISDPLRARADFIWTACESTIPVNFLLGSPADVAATLTEVFRSGGVGAWKRTARMATADCIRAIDATGEPRTLELIGRYLEEATSHDRDLKTVCAGWVARFLDLADQFGSSIGPDGIDIADLLRQGKTVLLDNDSFEHAALGGDVVALGLAEAKRCANLVPGGFRLIFEEAGQLGERIDLAEPFFRAGRRRKIPVDALTQAESDLNEGISANIATRVYFAQELKSLQKTAADRLGIAYQKLDPAAMRDFSAYISHGKIRRLVHFPKLPATTPRPSYEPVPTHPPTEEALRRRIVIREHLGTTPSTPLSLPAPSLEMQEVLGLIDRSHGDCWLWTGLLDRDGYGVIRWAYMDEPDKPKNNRPAHQVVWELVNGCPFPRDNRGRRMDWGHRRTCLRQCVNPYHGEPCTRRKNVQDMHRDRGHRTTVG